MTKRSGFAVKITAFIEADANDGESMATALRIIKEQYSIFTEARFIAPKLSSRFMLSREVPEEVKATEANAPKAAQAECQHRWMVGDFGPDICEICYAERPNSKEKQLPIPAALDRRGAKA